MRIVLVSTYDLGRQPFGVASPAAWLRAAGHTVACADLAVGSLPSLEVREADLVAVYVPMHTATRLAAETVRRIRLLNAFVPMCAYGLYAAMNEGYLRGLGFRWVIGGEFEPQLAAIAAGQEPARLSLDRIAFLPPDRQGLPVLGRYPKLVTEAGKKRSGATEASRGCKHLCRHCPVVPVYGGAFRVVPVDVVTEDVRRQVAGGAQHISFGDPDFFNGPEHARRIVEAMHAEFPRLTYDVTVKVEHLLRHDRLLPVLKATGCLFVTTAAESVEERVLERLDKGHTRADIYEVVRRFRELDLALAPTFLPFTPWTTLEGYRQLLSAIVELDLVDAVAPVQLMLRLLIPSGSRLLELEEIRAAIGPFDEAALSYPWRHPDPAVDALAKRVAGLVRNARASRRDLFPAIWEAAHGAPPPPEYDLLPRTVIPYMEEPWFC